MKIVFCSSDSGQTGTTSNLAAIASYQALHYHNRLFLMQSRYDNNSLDEAFLGERVEEDGIQENGIDSLIRMMKSEPVSKEMIDSCAIDVYQNRLYLLPGTLQKNEAMYETIIQPMLVYSMNAVNQNYDITYVDAGVIEDWKKSRLLKHADVIVMNVCQNHHLLKRCFAMEQDYKDKLFYLVGSYDPVSKYNLTYIQNHYKVKRKRIGVIPYNSMFRDAYSDGAVTKFISQVDQSTKDEMNYYFINQLATTVRKLLEFVPKERRC